MFFSKLGIVIGLIIAILIVVVLGCISFGFASLVLATYPTWFKIFAAIIVFLVTAGTLVRD